MKRGRGDRSDGTSKSREGAPSKRTKSSQACAACRRHKTRCELLDAASALDARLKCHRCKVLNVECSFETSEAIHIIQSLPTPPTAQNTDQLCSAINKTVAYSNAGITIPPIVLPCGRVYGFEIPVRTLRSSLLLKTEYGTTNVKAEDLVPSPNSLWGIMNIPAGFDWTAKPVLAIQELTKVTSVQTVVPVQLGPYDHLGTVLSPEQTVFLLNIFEVKYEPWIFIETRPSGNDTPLLDLVRCLVASRHLEPNTRARVVPQLQKLVEDACLQQVFNRSPSLEYVEALIILSLWSPVGGALEQEPRDPRLLISSAVTTSMNLEVLQASQKVISLREKEKIQNGLPPAMGVELSEAVHKSSWSLRLSTVESMLCIGTGRQPLSRHSDVDLEALNLNASSTLDSSRQTRLAMVAKLFEWTEKGCKLHLEPHTLPEFHADAVDILSQLECIKRFIMPQIVVAPYDNLQFHVLLLQYFGCRLLFLHHILQEIRRVFEPIQKPWFRVECDGNAAVICLTRDALAAAEGVLTHMLSWHDHCALATVPDSVFELVSFAAAWLVISNFAMYQAHASQLGGSCNRLILAAIPRLSKIALSPDHAPAKCSRLISTLYGSWEKLVGNSDTACPASGNGIKEMPEQAAAALSIPQPNFVNHSLPALDTYNTTFNPPAFAPDEHLEDIFNSELFADNDFWATFMVNIAPSTVE